MPEPARSSPIWGLKLRLDLRKRRSRLWESNPRPTHYEGDGQRRLWLLPATMLTSDHSGARWSCSSRPRFVSRTVSRRAALGTAERPRLWRGFMTRGGASSVRLDLEPELVYVRRAGRAPGQVLPGM